MGGGRHLELYVACDADRVTADALLLRRFAEGGGRDVTRAEDAARALMEWAEEHMAEHGWSWHESPAVEP
ncbi:DUF6300 family protein [Streptomyces sp. NPDC056930]|uniref:DUF6300 family protein n=1 Tax=Streptomyces sp. NPDC056930 TaxID=3345967 RepID=UPI003640F986